MIRALRAFTLDCALVAPSAAAQKNATIAGRIVNTTKAAVVGAEVQLAPGSRRVVSDESGRFKFAEVPPGNVTLVVKRIGFLAESLYVTVAAREDRDIVVELEQAAQPLDTVNVAAAENPIVRGQLAGFYDGDAPDPGPRQRRCVDLDNPRLRIDCADATGSF